MNNPNMGDIEDAQDLFPSEENSSTEVDQIVIPLVFLLLLIFICCISPFEDIAGCFRRRRYLLRNCWRSSDTEGEHISNGGLNLQSLNEGMWMKVSTVDFGAE